MDLISIKRKYRNKRKTIISVFLVIMFIILLIIIREKYLNIKYENIYLSYVELIERAKLAEQRIAEQKEAERLAKLPQLTDVGKNNLANIYRSETKRVFLTFDDGPSKTVTTKILDVLKQENVKATFFLLGYKVDLHPKIVKRQYDEGHYLANHGFYHDYPLIYASPQSVLDEYNKTLSSIRNAIDAQEYNPHLFRFPGGYSGTKYAEIKEQAAKLLEQNGILNIDWNALTADSAGEEKAETVEEFIAELDKTVPKYNSVVVLMHDAGDKIATADALPTIIQYFRDRGYIFENFYSIIK